jgi:predicted outer membrane repeat protein
MRPGARPRVEALEDRSLPSVFTVNSLGDTGTGSGTSGDLRYCITQAQTDPTDATINFAVTGTITLEQALPDLRKLVGGGSLLDIEGGGAVMVQRDPAATTPLFAVFTIGQTGGAGAVRIGGLTISGGNAGPNGHGGGVQNRGPRTVIADCVFSGNSAGFGGAVSNSGTLLLDTDTFGGDSASNGGAIEAGGIVTINNCTIIGETAALRGGAIYGGGTLSVSNSTFSNNSANFDGGAVYALLTSQGVWAFTSTTFTGNTAGGNGGAVGADGNTMAFNVLLSGCTLANNQAGSSGGGLYTADTATVTNSTFTGNSAASGGAVACPSTGGNVTITGSTFTGNSAVDGGAVAAPNVTIGTSTFTGNTATDDGGALAGLGLVSPSTITGSTFSQNGAARGGAIAFAIQPFAADTVIATINGCNFTNDSASAGGGALYGTDATSGASSLSTVAVTASTFTGNTAGTDGGAIDVAPPGSSFTSAVFEVTADDCTFANNSATGNGGAIANADRVAVSRSTFAGNTATNGGGLYDGLGHGFSPSAANAQVINCTFTQNSAVLGGAIFGSSPGASTNGLQIAFSTIAGNQVGPSGHGGGVAGAASDFVANIVAGNARGSGSDDIFGNVGGVFAGYNLVGDGTGSNLVDGVNHNIVGTTANPVDPMLGPLQDNGGPTFTMALAPGSPAVDAGGSNDPFVRVPSTDQRGYLRVYNGQPDIGAFELQPLTVSDTVTTLADSGPGSLRDVITRADAMPDYQNVITFAVTGTIDLLSALPNLTGNLLIQGPGADQLTVQRDSALTTPSFTVFVIGFGGSVEIDGLTIRGGRQNGTTGEGGGVLNQGTLTLNNDILTANSATYGGGVFNFQHASLTVNGCTISANLTGSGGGGIYADFASTVTVMNSTITGNLAGGNIGFSEGNEGGGIMCLEETTVTLSNSVISNNQAVTNTFGFGGGGIACTGGNLTLSNCTVSGNEGVASGQQFSYRGEGGAIYLFGNSSFAATLTISHSTFSGNTAGTGGAVYASNSASGPGGVTVIDCTFTNNTATQGDSSNGGPGGAIANALGSLAVTDSTFANNTALLGTSFSGGRGGAIANSGSLVVSGSTFYGNSATGGSFSGGSGGALFTGGPGAAGTATATITNSTFFGNSADGNGGAIAAAGGTLVINNSTIAGNQAGDTGHGGGILVGATGFTSANVTLYDTIVAGNQHGTVGDDISGSVNPATSIFNLIGDGTGGSLVNGIGGNLVGTASSPIDPMLSPLQDNGGPTWTMALLPGSPAVDSGDNDGVPATDQRGFPRIVGGTVDIGAFEVQPGPAVRLVASVPAAVSSGVPFDVTVVALDDFGHVATGYNGTVTFSTTDTDPGVVLPADYTFTANDQGAHTFSGGVTLITAGPETFTIADLADGFTVSLTVNL